MKMRWEQTPQRARHFGAIRSALIGYGALALTLFWSRSGAVGEGSSRSLLLWGIGLQVVMLVASKLVTRYSPDADSAAKGRMLLELVADGVTVALFAIATLGAVMGMAAEA